MDWTAVAADLVPPAESRPLLAHAATCNLCGPSLAQAVADLFDDPSPQEQRSLESLASSGAPWQAAMAKQLSGVAPMPEAVQPRSSRVSIQHGVAFAIAATLFLIVSTFAVLRRPLHSPSPQALLADAYTEHRTLELRIAGAKHAPIRVQRGAGASNLDKPASLLRAESLIAEQLHQQPHDIQSLDAKARADLLDGNFESAIETLQRAMQAQPLSPVLLTDLATAYFSRAESNGRAIDYGRALDSLGRVLAGSANDNLALFNRAIVEERMFLYDLALADWQHFLQVEAEKAWHDEGAQRLEDLRQKIKDQNPSGAIPLRDPSAANIALRRGDQATWPPTFDEAYLDLATTEWLRIVSTMPSHTREQAEAWAALHALAVQVRHRHGDDWLFDLISGPHTPAWVQGARELAAAARANLQGNSSDLLRHAANATRSFHTAGNHAGEAAARLELAIGLNRAENGGNCLPAVNAALAQTEPHRFPWVRAQALFELSTCGLLNGRPRVAMLDARGAATLSEKAGYPLLQLKGQYYLDGVTTSWVASSTSWDQIRAGLKSFWLAPYPRSAAAELYGDLGFAAETEEMWQVAERAGRESVLMSSLGENRVVQAAAHHWLAQVAETVGDAAFADKEYETARIVLASSGIDPRAAQVTLEIERAAVDVRRSNFQAAAQRLDTIKPSLNLFSKQYARILYLQSLGEVNRHFGKPALAKAELQQAIQLIETNLQTLKSQDDLLVWQHDTAPVYRSMVDLYSRGYHDDVRSFALLEWYRAAPLRAHRIRDRLRANKSLTMAAYFPADLKVPIGSALVTWMISPDSLAMWLVDAKGVHAARVNVSQATLEAAAQTFSRGCANPSSDRNSLDTQAQQLYRWLLQPLGAFLNGATTLVIEPDDHMASIPFQALESGARKYLGDRFFIVESPGVGYASQLRSNRDISSSSVILAVGNPLLNDTGGVQFRSLPDADKEAHDIALKFNRRSLLLGPEATLDHVIGKLPAAEIFHFAGHALSQGPDPGLLLANPQTSGAAVLDRSKMKPIRLQHLELAVLSACDTAFVDGGLTDPKGLVRLFQAGGVPGVVASKWPVDSAASAGLMKKLYERLLEKHHVGPALTLAARDIRSNPETAHPYYWAAFSDFGAN